MTDGPDPTLDGRGPGFVTRALNATGGAARIVTKAAGANGSVGGSYRIVMLALSISLSLVSFFGYRTLAQYDARADRAETRADDADKRYGDMARAVDRLSNNMDNLTKEIAGRRADRDKQFAGLEQFVKEIQIAAVDISKRVAAIENKQAHFEGETERHQSDGKDCWPWPCTQHENAHR